MKTVDAGTRRSFWIASFPPRYGFSQEENAAEAAINIPKIINPIVIPVPKTAMTGATPSKMNPSRNLDSNESMTTSL
jgi:hypothetical protein